MLMNYQRKVSSNKIQAGVEAIVAIVVHIPKHLGSFLILFRILEFSTRPYVAVDFGKRNPFVSSILRLPTNRKDVNRCFQVASVISVAEN